MKYFPVYILFFLLLTGCVNKQIEYQDVKNIKILSVNSDEITLSADAVFKNPNILGGKVYPENLKVYIADKEITTVEAHEFKVPAVKEFSVPLKATIPFKKIPGYKNGGLLGAIIGGLTQTHKISFKGKLNYKVVGVTSSYTIDHTEELKLEL